jgi:predicted Zn-dependent protease
MSQASGRASQSGQYAELRTKIEKVATQALRTAAQSSKAVKNTAGKTKKSVNSRKSGK